jgi:hypothetical protein
MATDVKASNYLRRHGPAIDHDLLADADAELAALAGEHRHFCPDWDYLAIDENSPEWQCCTCGLSAYKKTE